jgi:hypothetical protein
MEIKIGGREIPMILSSLEMLTIQEEIGCTVAQLRDEVFAVVFHPDADTEKGEQAYTIEIMKDAKKVKKMAQLIRICGNAGLEEAGQEPDLTDKWILRNIKPGRVLPYALIMMAAVNDAMRMETAETDERGPVDEVLAEENRKKEPGSSPTGESAPADSSPDSGGTK